MHHDKNIISVLIRQFMYTLLYFIEFVVSRLTLGLIQPPIQWVLGLS